MRAPVNPRTLFVKLNWGFAQEFTDVTNFNQAILGNYIQSPILDPTTNSTNPPGVPYPMGLIRYGQFYRRVTVMAAKIVIRITNIDGTGADAVLLTMPGVPSINAVGGGGENYIRAIASDQSSLLSWPGTVWKSINNADAGGSIKYMSKYAKTKRVLSVNNVRDYTSGRLIDTTPQSEQVGGLQEFQTWFFLLRVFAATASTYRVAIKVRYYCMLHDREFVEQPVVPEPEFVRVGASAPQVLNRL